MGVNELTGRYKVKRDASVRGGSLTDSWLR